MEKMTRPKTWIDFLCKVAAVALVVMVIIRQPDPAQFKEIVPTTVFGLLGALFVIALFMERAMEVYIATTRAPEAAEMDWKIKEQKESIKTLKASDPAGNTEKEQDALKQIEKERMEYKLETMRISLWWATLLGLLISAAGVRTLGTFVEQSTLNALPEFQRAMFYAMDVIITGGLIAGGSDGIHKMTKVYTTYMEEAAERMKGKK